jgi:S-adenosylmethionine-diacylglycerol 3-amino-3-carboxypropyl transferase
MKTEFNKLNYSFLNEDPEIEAQLLPDTPRLQLHIGAIAGSGFRLLPLLEQNPVRLSIFDVSKDQLNHTQMLLNQIRNLTWSNFLNYWDPLEAHGQSPLYQGRHEMLLQKRSFWIQRLLGGVPFENLIQNPDSFPKRKWQVFLKIYSYLLWFAEKNSWIPKRSNKESFIQILQRMDHALWLQAPHSNFFLQQTLWGRCQDLRAFENFICEQRFLNLQSKLRAVELNFVCGPMQESLSNYQNSFDFLSVSNVVSYLSLAEQATLLKNANRALKKGGRVVVRSFLNHPILPKNPRWLNLSTRYQPVLSKERTGAYSISVLERVSDETY